MIDFPTTFVDTTQPLAAELGDQGNAALKRLTTQGYELHLGLTKELAQAISVMAREPNIREYCPRDSSERFSDLAATERWLAKHRAVFLLLERQKDASLQLVGYGWSGPGTDTHVPVGETTFALRIGEAGQGQGLATPFCWLIVAATAALYGARNFWLETWISNAAAVHIYHKLDFETVAEETGVRPTANGGEVADKRLYMQLSNQLLPH
jgi:ribosomal protein S18 acetylase RimI-like enzyme